MTQVSQRIPAAFSDDSSVAATPPPHRPSWIPQRWYIHLALIAICIILGFPVIYAVIVSTQNNAQVFRYQFSLGESFGNNWDVVMNSRNLGRYMVNSIIISVAVTVGKTILSLLSGLAFVYFRFRGKWLVFGLVLITLMMPTEILIIALLRFVTELGWGSTYYALIVPFLASATGTFFISATFFQYPKRIIRGRPIGWSQSIAVFVASVGAHELEYDRSLGGDPICLHLEYVFVAASNHPRTISAGGSGGITITAQPG